MLNVITPLHSDVAVISQPVVSYNLKVYICLSLGNRLWCINKSSLYSMLRNNSFNKPVSINCAKSIIYILTILSIYITTITLIAIYFYSTTYFSPSHSTYIYHYLSPRALFHPHKTYKTDAILSQKFISP